MHKLCRLAVATLLTTTPQAPAAPPVRERDLHSYGNPQHVRVRHVALDLDVDFRRKRLKGSATLTVERTSTDRKQPLVLDSQSLRVSKV
jgi:aminopeptidase N